MIHELAYTRYANDTEWLSGNPKLANASSLCAISSAVSPVMPRSAMPSISRSRMRAIRAFDRFDPIAWRSWSASPGENPAASIAICMSCSWKSGTPSVLRRHGSRSGCG